VKSWTPEDREAAATFLAAVDDATQKGILDLLIGRPDERFDTAAVAKHLGLSDHKAVARATYAMGQALKATGYARPWTEAQQGYAMPAETANLFKSASST
jgi:hypothetical protein